MVDEGAVDVVERGVGKDTSVSLHVSRALLTCSSWWSVENGGKV